MYSLSIKIGMEAAFSNRLLMDSSEIISLLAAVG